MFKQGYKSEQIDIDTLQIVATQRVFMLFPNILCFEGVQNQQFLMFGSNIHRFRIYEFLKFPTIT